MQQKPDEIVRKKLERRAKRQMSSVASANPDGSAIVYGGSKTKTPSQIRSERIRKKLRLRDGSTIYPQGYVVPKTSDGKELV